MSFSGNHTARDYVYDLLTSSGWATILSAVATEQSVTLDTPRKVYQGPPPPGKWQFPNVEITSPASPEGVEQGSNSAVSTWVMWVILSETAGMPSELFGKMEGYMTALIRLFLDIPDDATDPYVEVVSCDTSPPGSLDQNQTIQSVGVQVAVTVIESES